MLLRETAVGFYLPKPRHEVSGKVASATSSRLSLQTAIGQMDPKENIRSDRTC